jgi:hypothetical protein
MRALGFNHLSIGSKDVAGSNCDRPALGLPNENTVL